MKFHKILIGYVGITLSWLFLFLLLGKVETNVKFFIIFISLVQCTLSDRIFGIFPLILRDGVKNG